ncbi:prepilin-type N-terminal cleavage/methylation domain-containing protein [Cyanobium gracile]
MIRLIAERRLCNKSQGFTLVELLLAAVLGVIVIGGLGASLLISEIGLQRRFESDKNLKDSVTRVSALMQREISFASNIELPTSHSCGGNTINNPVVIIGPRNLWRVTYGISSPNPVTGWQATTLVRCGPPYNSDGSFNLASNVTSVVIQNLTTSNPWVREINTDLSVTASGTVANALSRGINITLNLGNAGVPFSQSFAARSSTNPYYSMGDQLDNGGSFTATCTNVTSTPSSVICTRTTNSKPIIVGGVLTTDNDIRNHFYVPSTATNVTIVGDSLYEDIVYLPLPRAQYTTIRRSASSGSANCDRTSCYLSGGGQAITLSNINVLVFPDFIMGI